MKTEYRTIAGPSEGSYKEKGSKFYAFAFPVNSEKEVTARLNELRQQYHDARHHCYAYRLEADGSQFRANDDGEPAHTGGTPILGQIDKYGLTMVLIVVVRYFGGTLLGAGGLARAYKTAVADALSKSRPIKKFVTRSLTICFGYDKMNEIMRIVEQPGIDILEQDFAEECIMVLRVRTDRLDRIRDHLDRIAGVRHDKN